MKIGHVRDNRIGEILYFESDPETDICIVNGVQARRLEAPEVIEGEVVLGVPDVRQISFNM